MYNKARNLLGMNYMQFLYVFKKKIADLRKKTVFVFQNYNLFANKTALENDERTKEFLKSVMPIEYGDPAILI